MLYAVFGIRKVMSHELRVTSNRRITVNGLLPTAFIILGILCSDVS